MIELFNLIAKLVAEIVGAIKAGATDEEIRRRIADPSGVGAQIIATLRGGGDAIDEYVRRG